MTEDFIQENEDRELFRRIKQGSEEAFRVVYGKYHRILYAVALKMLKDRSAAENAVQHVFVKLWIGRQEMTVMLSLRNYLYTMTRNYILNYLRSRNTELVHSYRLAQLIPEASDPLDAQIEREDLLQMLDTVIAGLPTQKRQVMYLRKAGYSNPEIAEMQTNAVIKAALKVSAETGKMITPHIMIPLVGEVKELKFVKDVVVKTADALIAAAGVDMKYEVGTMIEIPRAALTAGEIAKEADFFSFGTNDLTQMTFGFSRDDAAKFLTAYYDTKIYESDPFQHLDQIGVGKLVKMAAHDGRATNPNLGLGICGEHGGDPSSVEFCHNVGLDYVSCSPYRVPIARLAAAQAAIKAPRAK